VQTRSGADILNDSLVQTGILAAAFSLWAELVIVPAHANAEAAGADDGASDAADAKATDRKCQMAGELLRLCIAPR
jgi:hypothetical protein